MQVKNLICGLDPLLPVGRACTSTEKHQQLQLDSEVREPLGSVTADRDEPSKSETRLRHGRRTLIRKISPDQYHLILSGGQCLSLSHSDIRRFHGYCRNGYAHETSKSAVSAYRLHCQDNGLPFICVKQLGSRGRRPKADSAPCAIRLDLAPGQMLNHNGRVAVFIVFTGHSPKGNRPQVEPTKAKSKNVWQCYANDVAEELLRIAKDPTYLKVDADPAPMVFHPTHTITPRERQLLLTNPRLR